MKLTAAFVLVCAVGLAIVAVRVVRVWWQEQAAPVAVRVEVAHVTEASTNVSIAEEDGTPGFIAEPDRTAELQMEPRDTAATAPVVAAFESEVPAETSAAPVAASETTEPASTSDSTPRVHWAPEGDSPALLQGLARARETLANDPYHPGALRDELAALRALGRWREAELSLKRLVEAEPDNLELKMEYARQLTREGYWAQAIAPLRQVVDREPDNLAAWSLLAAAHQTNGHLEAARQGWTRVIELSPEDAGAYANRGQVYVAWRDWARAAADLEKSFELDPGQEDTALALSQAYSEVGRHAEARELARGVLTRNPRNVRAMNRLAEALWRASSFDSDEAALNEARQWWQKSLATDPDQPAIRARLEETGK